MIIRTDLGINWHRFNMTVTNSSVYRVVQERDRLMQEIRAKEHDLETIDRTIEIQHELEIIEQERALL